MTSRNHSVGRWLARAYSLGGMGSDSRPEGSNPAWPQTPEPRPRSSAAGGAGPGRPAEARPPAPPADPGSAEGAARRDGQGSPFPFPAANLEVVAAEVHAAHERQHPGGLHGGAAFLRARRTRGGREPRAGSAPAPPLWPARASSRPPPLREVLLGDSQSCRPRGDQSSRTGEACRGPGGDDHRFQSPVATWRVGPGTVAWAAVAPGAGRDPGEIVVPTSGTQAVCV